MKPLKKLNLELSQIKKYRYYQIDSTLKKIELVNAINKKNKKFFQSNLDKYYLKFYNLRLA